MPYDKQLELKFRRFQSRILELEKAAEAQDRAIKQLAEKLGVEVDLAHGATAQEASAKQPNTPATERPLDGDEILEMLKQSERDDD